jgi:hypothetical protein
MRIFACTAVITAIAGCGSPSPEVNIAAQITAPSPVSITVGSNVHGTNVNQKFAGLSFEKGYLGRPVFRPENHRLEGLFKLLGKGIVRIGGGTCDEVTWLPDEIGQSPKYTSMADVNALAAFLSDTDWDVIYCLNLNLKDAPQGSRVDEATYVKKTLGNHLLAFEIGNEPEFYHWTMSEYLTQWDNVAGAVRQATDIAIAGPDIAVLGDAESWIPTLLTSKVTPDFFTSHFYADELGHAKTIGELLSADDIPYSRLSTLQNIVTRAALPYRISETSTFSSGGVKDVSDTIASALWAIEYLFAIANRDGTGANFHSLGHDLNNVLGDDNGLIEEVRPLYYGLLFFNLAGDGHPVDTTQDARGLDVTANALRNEDGSTSVFVVNKTAATAIEYGINIGRDVKSADALILTAPARNSTSGVTIQGESVGLDGSFTRKPATPISISGATASGRLAAGSAALVHLVPK